ncbi:MAG TPA: aminoacetone oxidase family FAD-binding enzyme, partial [Flavobacteriaceae bacterium]|nr:aminoacetone oxidase family FAD-binding enzyme [Flavobacteriaceae bacterium]
EKRGVVLKIEEDGRMFPVSDSSQTIIDCFLKEISRLKIDLHKNCSVKFIDKDENAFKISTTSEDFLAKTLVIATGSNPKVWKLLESLGHTIVPPVPSLFTFNIKDDRIADLPGIATDVSVQVISEKGKILLESQGPLLITHWGMSGPAILKLSAWGARMLEPTGYHFSIKVNWLNDLSESEAVIALLELKDVNPKQTLYKYAQLNVPKRLWQSLLKVSGISENEIWATISKKQLQNIAHQLTQSQFQVTGKSTFKEEFVTAGGIDLKEVNFKTFESKIVPNLYFAGEVLNIDAITGGFNFQNAWTGGFIVAQSLIKNI